MGWLERLFGTRPRVQPAHVDDTNFQAEVVNSDLPVLLDVWSPYCGPCQQLEPIVMKLAARFQGRVKVAEVNAREAPRTMRKLGITATPTVVYFRRGREVARTEGFRGEAWHAEIIETELLGGATG